jgi:YkoY family integral membrane protein
MVTLQALVQMIAPFLTVSWSDVVLVVALIFLEAALSADNAVALAAMVKHLPTPQEQNRALRWGIVGAYSFRILIILLATWIIEFKPAKVLGAAYLLWLCVQHFSVDKEHELERVPGSANFWQTIVLVELTDLAFSFDSIAASVAVAHNKTWILILGGVAGITLMRYVASFFIQWLDEFERLENAAYYMIALVGTRMFLEVLQPAWEIPEWVILTAVLAFFVWGFSKRQSPVDPN